MSIKNIIDGSYDVNAPIDIERLDTSIGTVYLSFNKIGNMCTFQIKNYSFIETMPSIGYNIIINMSDDSITPFKPNENITRDFYLTVAGVPRWCIFTWYVIMNNIEIYVGSLAANQTINITNSDPIIYNTD